VCLCVSVLCRVCRVCFCVRVSISTKAYFLGLGLSVDTDLVDVRSARRGIVHRTCEVQYNPEPRIKPSIAL
jgi:hypothetical protein